MIPPLDRSRPVPRRALAGSDTACRAAAIRTIILGFVDRVFLLPADRLESPSRGPRRTARGRQIAIYLAHVAVPLPLERAGALFGRSRSTAAHACRVIEEARDADRGLDTALDLIAVAITVALSRLES